RGGRAGALVAPGDNAQMSKSLLLKAGVVTSILGSIAASGALVSGCSGFGPGDYAIYRVSFSKETKSSGCYAPQNKVPPDEKYDSSTYRDPKIFILYAGANDARYLDMGDTTLEGTQDGDNFSFSGKSVDVQYLRPDGTGPKETTTNTTDVSFATDGD